ncbi:MAG: cupin domain-containing protein [Elusimicrobia bacterium]|nr:cupin domain-containing protein [Elusimicrobiota bacterium]
MSPEKILENWRSRGFHGGIWTDPAGQVWEDYVHGSDELFMALEGQVELDMQSKKLRPKPGEEILIPANTAHSVRNVGGTTARWLYAYKQ